METRFRRNPVWIKDDIVVEPIINGHVATEKGQVKSLSYKVVQVKKKLKPELVKLGGLEIKRSSKNAGRKIAILNTVKTY